MRDAHLQGPFLVPDGEIQQLVILLHGYGADGNDLIGLAPLLQRVLPQTAFFSPHAPDDCEIGFGAGRQWFSLEEFDPMMMRRNPFKMVEVYERLTVAAEEVLPLLSDYVEKLQIRFNLNASKTALVGFSQGTMMSLLFGLRQESALAGILGFSGALLGSRNLQETLRSKPPVQLVHGDVDPVVPYAAMSHATQHLKTANVPVKTHTCRGLGHGIDDDGLRVGLQFLQDIFTRGASS